MNRKFFHTNVTAVVFYLTVALGMTGCMFFDQEERVVPTTPSLENAGAAMNFYGYNGQANAYGIYKRAGLLAVNVPQAGDYLLVYKTRYGTFDLVFRTTSASRVHVGLHHEDEVKEVRIAPIQISVEPSVAETIGQLLIFSRPGNTKPLSSLSNLPEGVTSNELLVAPPASVVIVNLIEAGNLQAGDGVVEISETEMNPPAPAPRPATSAI